ncbi:uncharacterized protein LOC121500206 isoform X2 [Vulpes lagopus]|uniref:uncharacterized protein LOC121500206 isoform X2 n=1 Tax=Vulpes lagopus TaxID=494514 RepID=UPI001BC94851|nr:uncharacterized protein LOC121500206 isoform X2 [Vulpes lagopus]
MVRCTPPHNVQPHAHTHTHTLQALICLQENKSRECQILRNKSRSESRVGPGFQTGSPPGRVAGPYPGWPLGSARLMSASAAAETRRPTSLGSVRVASSPPAPGGGPNSPTLPGSLDGTPGFECDSAGPGALTPVRCRERRKMKEKLRSQHLRGPCIPRGLGFEVGPAATWVLKQRKTEWLPPTPHPPTPTGNTVDDKIQLLSSRRELFSILLP